MPRTKPKRWLEMSKAEFHTDGFDSFRGAPEVMDSFHRHNELEFNYIEQGGMSYIFGGSQVNVQAKCLNVFWAGTPHRVVSVKPGTTFQWVTVPLSYCLEWQLPFPLLHQVLFAKILSEPDASQAPHDQSLLRKWHEDLKSGFVERRRIVRLEVEARLRRFALSLGQGSVVSRGKESGGMALSEAGLKRVEQMAMYIAQNYQKPQMRVADIARSAALHPNYAMRLFRKTFGTRMVDYITQHRVMHAQRLLTLSDAKVLDVALESGFGSLSRFYVAFQNACGQSPGDYRVSLRKVKKNSLL